MRVLLVEDDAVIGDAIRRALMRDGHLADLVGTADKARAALQTEPFDLAIVDIGLPRESGLSLLRELRRQGRKLPVLMLTARDGLNDRVAALDLGADDYLTKPFQVPELLARCRALSRRAHGLASSMLVIGALSLDLGRRELAIGKAPVELTQREWGVLECLASERGSHRLEGQAAGGRLELGRGDHAQRHRGLCLAPARQARRRGGDPRGSRARIPAR